MRKRASFDIFIVGSLVIDSGSLSVNGQDETSVTISLCLTLSNSTLHVRKVTTSKEYKVFLLSLSLLFSPPFLLSSSSTIHLLSSSHLLLFSSFSTIHLLSSSHLLLLSSSFALLLFCSSPLLFFSSHPHSPLLFFLPPFTLFLRTYP